MDAVMLQPKVADTKVPSREELIRRAEALVPVLESRAAKAEEMRRCPDETIRDYLDNDLLRISQPARYGGFEHGYDVLCEVSQTLARGCGSQAWVHMVLADNILKLASYSAQAQEDVWGKDTTAKLSNCVTPVGKGRPVDGGVIWSGRHTFSSGVDHAQWVMAAGTIDHGDRKQACSVLVPKSDITIIDDWHVMGLAGTGSNTFVIDEAFVPRTASSTRRRRTKATRRARIFTPRRCSTCRAADRRPRASLPWRSASPKVSSRAITNTRARANPAARPWARWSARRSRPRRPRPRSKPPCACIMGALREAMGVLERGEPFTKHRQVQGKRNMAYAAQLAIHAVQRLYNDAGGRVLYTDNELQRKFRDVHAAAAHHSLNWHSAAEEYGRDVLGAEE